MVHTGDYNVLYTQNDIEARNMSIGAKINAYHKEDPLPSTWVCILDGGFRFFSDVTRYLAFDAKIDFCKVTSYDGTEKSEKAQIQRFKDEDGYDLPIGSLNRIYVFDDIADSGDTAKMVAEYYEANFMPTEMILCTVARRESTPVEELKKYYTDVWSLFQIEDEWLVGYGMDNPKGYMRQIPSILKMKK
jgi:hypoxanthine phosphoribosyltransferase